MNSSYRRFWLLTAVVLVCASVSLAQQTSVNLTGTGDSNVVWNGGSGVYVDPYTATVGGLGSTSVICDDWANNSYQNEQWTANVTSVTSLGSSQTPMFSGLAANASPWNTTAISQAQLYNALAWLGSQLLANPQNYQNQTEVSFALWELTYYAGLTGSVTKTDLSNPTTFLSGSAEAGWQSAISALIAQALGIATSATPFNAQGWEILTPTGSTCSSAPSTCPTWYPQEFLVYTPEASTIVMFAAGVLGLLAMAFFFRRNAFQPVS